MIQRQHPQVICVLWLPVLPQHRQFQAHPNKVPKQPCLASPSFSAEGLDSFHGSFSLPPRGSWPHKQLPVKAEPEGGTWLAVPLSRPLPMAITTSKSLLRPGWAFLFPPHTAPSQSSPGTLIDPCSALGCPGEPRGSVGADS